MPGQPGAQGGMRPVYKLSESDKKNAQKWATIGDPDDGGSVDYGQAAFMENLIARTGSFAQSVNLVNNIAQQARQRNPQLSPEDAKLAAMAFLTQQMNGTAPTQAPAQNGPAAAQQAPAGVPSATGQPAPVEGQGFVPPFNPQVSGADAQFAGRAQDAFGNQKQAIAAEIEGFNPAMYGTGTLNPRVSDDMIEGHYGDRRAAREEYNRRIQRPLEGVGFFGY